MPARKKRRWKKFINKVHAVQEKTLGSRTVVFSDSVDYNVTDAAQQVIADLGLYTIKSTTNHFNDLNKLMNLENIGANPTSAAGDTVQGTTKVMFQSGILDITVRNTSNDGADPTPALLTTGTLEVDVYELVVNYGKPDGSGTTYNRTREYFTRGDQLTLDIGGTPGSSTLSLNDRGVTPWDIPAALARSRIKIMTKKKYIISVGQSFTYQMRDPKRRISTIEQLTSASNCNRRGWTKHVLLLAHFVPGITASATVVPQITIGMTRKYLYKIDGLNDDRDHYQRTV